MRRRIFSSVPAVLVWLALLCGALGACAPQSGSSPPPSGCDNATAADGCRPTQPTTGAPDTGVPPADDGGKTDSDVAVVLPPSPVTPAPDASTGGEPKEKPPVDTAPPGPDRASLVRYPMLDAADTVAAESDFVVSVALTEEQLTADVTVKHPAREPVTDPGALTLDLPAGAKEWPIDVDLLAPGFDLADGGAWSRQLRLYEAGDSDVLRFRLRSRAASPKPRQLIARFYHAGRFLGSASRPVEIVATAPRPPPGDARQSTLSAPAGALATAIAMADDQAVPDLDVTIHYDDPEKLGRALIVLHSPHLSGVVSAEFETPAAMNEWLISEYRRLMQLGLGVRGAKPVDGAAEPVPDDPQSRKRFAARMVEGFGDDLYRQYVPAAFKQQFWSLQRRGKLKSIQITSNSPALPWELVRPIDEDGDETAGFLGISYRLARWAPRDASAQLDQPIDRVMFTGVAAIAPAYAGERALPFQKVEVDALSKLKGFRRFDGSYKGFEKMIGEVSSGFIHFSGHGALNQPNSGAPVFAIELLDQSLDPSTWRSLMFGPSPKGNPFYFFNACDSGQSKVMGGFVQGWGPAILSSGAAGFIGGMWPLTDRTAAAFSTSFYGELAESLPSGPVYVAGVLQDVRRKFYETGDPVYLAYTFYGNANLRVETPPN